MNENPVSIPANNPTLPAISSSTPITQPEESLKIKMGKLGDRIVSFITEASDHIATRVFVGAITISNYIFGGVGSLFSVLSKTFPKNVDFDLGVKLFSDIKQVAVLSIISIPFTLLDTGRTFFSFIKEVYNYVKTGNPHQLISLGLLTIAAVGDFLEIPVKIAGAVALFQKVPLQIWTSVLGTIAAVFSVASIIYTFRNHRETSKIIDELEEKSSAAILKNLKELAKEGQIEYPKGLANIDKNELIKEIDNALDPANINKLHQSFNKLMAKVGANDKALIDDLTLVGQKAYLECLKGRDEAFLTKHFQIGGDKIQSALKAIENSNDIKHIKDVQSLLDKQIKYKLLSDKLNVVADLVALAASVMFIALDFGLACSPLAPIAYALIVAVGVFAIGKAVYDVREKKRSEKELSLLEEKLLRVASPILSASQDANLALHQQIKEKVPV